MRRRWFAAVLLPMLLTGFASADDGPWRPQSLWSVEALGSIHFLDHADVNSYLANGDVDKFGWDGARGYWKRATPVFGARFAFVMRRFIGDAMIQYYNISEDGPSTGSTLSGVHFLFHAGVDLVHTRFQLYPYFGLGWSYTNFIVNGNDNLHPRFPDFAGAKAGIPGDAGIGLTLLNPVWTAQEPGYRRAVTIPITLQAGYQGEVITFFWQIKHGELARSVQDRFIGPYVRLAIGGGKGTFTR